jgi:hypothetical protein
MTVINRLIRQAKDGATELRVRPCDVRTLAESVRMVYGNDQLTIELAIERIERGDLRLLGVPVRVGAPS